MNFSHHQAKNVNNMSKHVEQLVWVGALGLLKFWYILILHSTNQLQNVTKPHHKYQKWAFSTVHTDTTIDDPIGNGRTSNKLNGWLSQFMNTLVLWCYMPLWLQLASFWTLPPTHGACPPEAPAIISPLTKHSLQRTQPCPLGGRRLDENELRHFES